MHRPGSYGNVPDLPLVRILGPVGLRDRDGELVAPPPTGRSLLAALGLAAGEVAPAQRLQEILWPDGEGGRAGLQTAVHRLRAWLDRHANGGVDVVTTASGYQLTGGTDLARFRGLVRRAETAGDLERLDLLRQALALWTGEPLANVAPARRDEEAVRSLVRERLTVARAAAEVAVRAGEAGSAVQWLLPLATAHRLDEPIQAALVRALAAAGREEEARDWFDGARKLLADRLGLEPGDWLRAAYRQLDRPPATDPPPRASPCTLPADLADFAGRDAELAAVWQALGSSQLVVVSGPAGSGTTALAVHAAHGLRGAYPAGQLFAAGPDPLVQFVRVGGPGPDPLLGLLLVADEPPDLAALLAARPDGAALIVTSRDAPPAGIPHVRLGPLGATESRELFTRAAGRSWPGESAALDQVIAACEGSPARLRAAAALLARRPHWTIDDLAIYLERGTVSGH